jgi:hypothetical protein
MYLYGILICGYGVFGRQTRPTILHLHRLCHRLIPALYFGPIDLNSCVRMSLLLHTLLSDSCTLIQIAHYRVCEFRIGGAGIISNCLVLHQSMTTVIQKHSRAHYVFAQSPASARPCFTSYISAHPDQSSSCQIARNVLPWCLHTLLWCFGMSDSSCHLAPPLASSLTCTGILFRPNRLEFMCTYEILVTCLT